MLGTLRRQLLHSRPVSPFESLARYVPPSTLDRVAPESLKLDYNEATVPPAPAVTAALKNFVQNEKLFLYPALDGGSLRQKLIDFCSLEFPTQDLVVTSGSDEALRLLFAAYPGVVFVPQPSYPQIEMFGNSIFHWEPPAEAIDYLRGDTGRNFRQCDEIFRSALISAASEVQPAILYLISPNNPTGQEISDHTLAAISAAFPESLVILDQAYFEFGDFSEEISDPSRFPNVVVVRTFSKCLGLASLRLGYFFGQSEILAGPKNLANAKAVNAAAQVAGQAVLANMGFYKEYAEKVKRGRKTLQMHLGRASVETIAGGGNFICVKCPGDVKETVQKLEREHGIFVRDISSRFPGFFRITIPGDENQLTRLILALDAVLLSSY